MTILLNRITNLVASNCFTDKLDSAAFWGAFVAFNLFIYKFLSSPRPLGFVGLLIPLNIRFRQHNLFLHASLFFYILINFAKFLQTHDTIEQTLRVPAAL